MYVYKSNWINKLFINYFFLQSLQIPQSNLSGYRSPKRRPSPGPSPGLGCGSIPTGSESNTSAPCSPASHSLGNNGLEHLNFPNLYKSKKLIFTCVFRQYEQFQSTEYYLNPSIQQHFEQFSLVSAFIVIIFLFSQGFIYFIGAISITIYTNAR